MSTLTLTDIDKEHLSEIATRTNWQLIARTMQLLNWRWYDPKGRPPNAGEIRDVALRHLADCIRSARSTGVATCLVQWGGLELLATMYGHVEGEEAEVFSLSCAFVLTSTDSMA